MKHLNTNKREVNGILLLDKPPDIRSNRVLQRCKSLLNAHKAGHGGTLDEAAEGALPIMFGSYTKLAKYFLNSYKIYECTIKLGIRTDTGDSKGNVIKNQPTFEYTKEQINLCLAKFLGHITQTPPIYSSIKYKGKPMHKYARSGLKIPIKSRVVHIRNLDLLSTNNSELNLRVDCSKGTYIRSLADDIGEELGCGAHVSRLRRTSIESIPSKYMVGLDQFVSFTESKKIKAFVNCEEILEHINKVFISISEAHDFCRGKVISYQQDTNYNEVCVFLQDNSIQENTKLIGIGELVNNLLHPRRILYNVIE